MTVLRKSPKPKPILPRLTGTASVSVWMYTIPRVLRSSSACRSYRRVIHLVKTANPNVLPAGGAVTYTYLVTNPGTAPLSNVSIADNKCTGLPNRFVGHPGDVNKNGLLDPGETFYFSCQSNITQTTTNIGTAEGTANGLTALDISPATVVVNPPALPNTGLPPRGTSTSWNIIMVAGALMVSTALVATLKKKRVA